MQQAAITIGGRYVLHQKLGSGGMGVVYRAADRLTQDTVALKRVSVPGDQLQFASQPLRRNNSNFRLALAQEFKTLASLRHPHIISVLDYGFDKSRLPYLTMEYLANASTIIEAGQNESRHRQIELLVQMLQALAYLHRRTIIHRDLKPENVLVVKGQVKVLDFGLARARTHLTEASRDIVGTLAYMAPEVLEGDPANEASDLYAVGVIAYQLFTGEYPFDTSDYASLMSDVLLKIPDLGVPNLNDALVNILEKLLAKNPDKRYSDAQSLIKAYAQATNRLDLLSETIAIRESYLQAAQFVGRNAELTQLTDALQAVQMGLDSAWLVGGESGVGKTRLLDELRTQAMVEGVLVLRGQAVREGAAPYQVWRDVLRRLCLEGELSDLEAGVLKALVPDVAVLLDRDIPDMPALDPQTTYERLLIVIESIFRRQPQPLVLMLEDLHWARQESLALVNRLTRGRGKEALVVVASYRDDERPDLLNELPAMRLIKLSRLRVEDITALSVSMLGTAGRDPKLINLLQRETEGNTFFIVEVVRALAQGAGQLANISTATLPRKISAGGIEAVIKRRLDRVPVALVPLLQVAATAGRELNLKILEMADIQMRLEGAALDEVPPEDDSSKKEMPPSIELEEGLSFSPAPAVGGSKKTRPLSLLPGLNHWLNQCAAITVLEVKEGRWRFAHERLRQGLLADISGEEQKRLHRQVADAVELAYPEAGEYAATLAHHWTEAGDMAKSAHYSALAGKQAVNNGALEDAVMWLKRAVDIQDQAEASAYQQAQLHRLLAEAYYGLGQPVESRYHLQQTLVHLGWSMPTGTGALVQGVLKQSLHHIGHLIRPVEFSLSPSDLSSPNSAGLLEAARAYERLAQIFYIATETVPALYATLHGFNLAQQAGPSPELVRFYANMVGVYRFAHFQRLAERSYHRAKHTARQLEDSSALAWSLFATSILSVGFHTWAELQDDLEQAMALFEQLGNRRSVGDSLVTLGYIFYFQGQFDKSIETAVTLFQLGNENDNLEHQAWGLTDQARSLLRLGQIDQATNLLDQGMPLLSTIEQSRIAEVQTYGLKAVAFLRLGKMQAAQQTAEATSQLLGAAPPMAFSLFEGYAAVSEVYLTLWGETLAAQTGPESEHFKTTAHRACRTLHKYATQFPVGKPRAWLYSGWFEWLSGRPKRGHKHWRKSLAFAQELEMPYEEGLTHYHIGRYLAGDDPARKLHLTTAVRIFEQLGAGYDLEQAQAALQRA